MSAGLLGRLYLEDLGWGWVLEHKTDICFGALMQIFQSVIAKEE